MARMRVWEPWIEETRQLILKTSRWVFAALILSFLVFANMAAILTILVKFKELSQ